MTTTQEAKMPEFQEQFLTETMIPMAEKIASAEYTPYTGELVAGMTPMQEQALTGYGALTLPSEFGEATDVYRGMAQRTPEERQADISAYTQAYTSNVIDPTMAAMQRQRAQARVGEEAQAIKSGAFGGDRRSVYEGERQGALRRRWVRHLARCRRKVTRRRCSVRRRKTPNAWQQPAHWRGKFAGVAVAAGHLGRSDGRRRGTTPTCTARARCSVSAILSGAKLSAHTVWRVDWRRRVRSPEDTAQRRQQSATRWLRSAWVCKRLAAWAWAELGHLVDCKATSLATRLADLADRR